VDVQALDCDFLRPSRGHKLYGPHGDRAALYAKASLFAGDAALAGPGGDMIRSVTFRK